MTKVELVKAVATETGFTQKDVKEVLDTMQNIVFGALKTEDVKVMDGVTLSAIYKEEHEGRNPQTGATIVIPGKWAPKCKFGKAIKDVVNA